MDCRRNKTLLNVLCKGIQKKRGTKRREAGAGDSGESGDRGERGGKGSKA